MIVIFEIVLYQLTQKCYAIWARLDWNERISKLVFSMRRTFILFPRSWSWSLLWLQELCHDFLFFVPSRFTGTDGPSGFGFELTFRLKRETGESAPPTWPAELMQGLARYVFQSGTAGLNTLPHFSCSHSERPCLLHSMTLVSSVLSQILGIIFVWKPKRVWSFCQSSWLGKNLNCYSYNSKFLVLKRWRYRTVSNHRKSAQWLFVAFLCCWFCLHLVRKPHLLILKQPPDKISLLSRRAVTSKKVAVPSQVNLFLWSLQLSSSNACKQGVVEMRKCKRRDAKAERAKELTIGNH